MQSTNEKPDPSITICQHVRLLGHSGYGVTELRIFKPRPMVAYSDNEKAIAQLVNEIGEQTPGIYIGVQPRPLHLFDNAPNCWRPSVARSCSNCACDNDIEFITTCFFDIDVVSEQRKQGHPASEDELQQSYQAAKLLSREKGLALNSTICGSGNGHYALTPIVPIPVDGDEVPLKFRHFCQQLAEKIADQVSGVRIDSVYNLSRVMRLMGTINGKGQAIRDRPHRRAHFVIEPIPAKSMALHQMILATDITLPSRKINTPSGKIRCDLSKIEKCEFIKWCRRCPMNVSEPQWFAMITNLAHLEGGPELIHEISRLDMFRYDYRQTQRSIERVLDRGYSPTNCESISKHRFCCSKLGDCQARAPMYLTDLFSVWQK